MRTGSWVWVVDVFCSFFFGGPVVLGQTKLGRCVRTGNTFPAVRHWCTAVAHGGRVDRFVDVFMVS